MSANKAVRDVDNAAIGMIALYPVVFRADIVNLIEVFFVLSFLMVAIICWRALRNKTEFSLIKRFCFVAVATVLVAKYQIFPQKYFQVAVFLLGFCFFSTEDSRIGRALRCLVGLFVSIAMFSSFPTLFGLPGAILALIVFIGGLISVWSDMSLNRSLWWFAKRSIRKETVFLLMFLAGISAIGLRQASNYANRHFGVSGLSGSLAPGSLQHLMLSSALALRIKFNGRPPLSPEAAYIRGSALDHSQGLLWTQASSRIRPKMLPDKHDFEYEVWISSRYSDYMPVLDYGVSVKNSAAPNRNDYGRSNGVFYPADYLSSIRGYIARSRLIPFHRPLEGELDQLLQHNGNYSKEIRRISDQLGPGPGDVNSFISRLSKFYVDSGFKYSLNPGPSSVSFEKFLDSSKVGFCEHFAAASATLGRIQGIPSRVVSGFLGGSWDEESQTLFVRDFDAHAWTEFWDVKTMKWVRYDAVRFIEPSRVERGAEYFLRSIGANIPDEDALNDALWMAELQMIFDSFISSLNVNIALSASQTFIDYGEELALLGVAGLTVSYILLVRRRYRRMAAEPQNELIRELETVLTGKGFPRRQGEPVYSWLLRSSDSISNVKPALVGFALAHGRFCHGRSRIQSDLIAMRQELQKIKIALKP